MAAQVSNDILWQIFLHNADISTDVKWDVDTGLTVFEPNALLVARYQSQVCSHWRNTILSFPSIWSRIINTRLLSQATDEWKSEVIRRTQTSPLKICAVIGGKSDGWVTKFLEDNWTRVEELALYLHTNTPDFDKSLTRRILLQPTPTLKALVLHPIPQDTSAFHLLPSTTSQDQVPGLEFPQPFPRNMPGLKSLQLENTLIVFNALSVHAFRNIHTLFLRFSLNAPTTSDLLMALARMPSLKIFGLRNTVINQASDSSVNKLNSSSEIDLPNLHSLSLATNVVTCTTFLTFLKPDSTRHLHIKALSSQSLSTTGRKIEHIALSLAEPVWVSISPKTRDFMFQFFWPNFFLWFSGSMPIDPMANPFRNCRFDTVNQLSLERRRPVEPHLIRLLSQFVNVEVLNISIQHLESLVQRDEQNIPFPRLRIVVLNLHHDAQHCTKYGPARMIHICEWLKSRKVRGQQLEVLDLGITPKMSMDAQCLEDVEGLTVRWTNVDQTEHSEYICGSGFPKRLQFPHLYFQSQCTLPEFAAHSPEELRFAYMTFGREMSSVDLLEYITPNPSTTLADGLRLLEL